MSVANLHLKKRMAKGRDAKFSSIAEAYASEDSIHAGVLYRSFARKKALSPQGNQVRAPRIYIDKLPGWCRGIV